MDIKHFTTEEFSCKCGCGLNNINPKFLSILEEIRLQYARPMFITSGSRCDKYNKLMNGEFHSAHLVGLAADIKTDNDNCKYELVMTALSRGIRRIGVGKSFVHLDTGEIPVYNQDVLWVY